MAARRPPDQSLCSHVDLNVLMLRRKQVDLVLRSQCGHKTKMLVIWSVKFLLIIWSVCVQILPPVRSSTPETRWSWKWRTPWSVMWLGSFLLLWSSPGPRTDRRWLKEPASTFPLSIKISPSTSSPNWTSPPNKETSTAAQWPIQPWRSHRPGSGVRNFIYTDNNTHIIYADDDVGM